MTSDSSLLRQAAASMRELANCTSRVDRWEFLLGESDEGDLYGYVRAGVGNHRYTVADCDYSNDAEHIASWHPEVALGVAEWLEALADENDKGPCDQPDGVCNRCEHDYSQVAALALAELYLRSAA